MTTGLQRSGQEGEEFLHFRLRFRPPMNVETLFETLFGLHRDGKNFRHPLQSAVMAREHETYLGGPPIWLQKPLIAALRGSHGSSVTARGTRSIASRIVSPQSNPSIS
jgi:hypothetical protein